MLSPVSQFLQAQVLDGMSRWQPDSGALQGVLLSPLLSNIYLDPLDHLLAQHGFEMVRYADDVVILCRTASEAQQTLRLVEDWTRQNGLSLHPAKTQIVDVNETGFDFLGYHFLGTRHWVSQKAVRTVKAKSRQLTPRKSGVSLTVTITRLNSMLRNWLNYFQLSRPWVFPRLDTFIRQRLRSIVRRRSKRKGCARNGMDNLRWPNAFFAEHGLLNLAAAHAMACQSSRR